MERLVTVRVLEKSRDVLRFELTDSAPTLGYICIIGTHR